MDFNFSKEQEQLSDSIQRFVAREYAPEKRKAVLKSKDGFSREVWAQLGELGLLALLVPEEHGGMGAGAMEVLLAMNAFGKGLLLEPYLPSAILGTAHRWDNKIPLVAMTSTSKPCGHRFSGD